MTCCFSVNFSISGPTEGNLPFLHFSFLYLSPPLSFLGSSPKGDDVLLNTGGLLFVCLFVHFFVCSFVQLFVHSFVRLYIPPAWRLKSQPVGSNPSLRVQIPAWRPISQPHGSNPSLTAQIPALRLKSQPQGSNPSLKA